MIHARDHILFNIGDAFSSVGVGAIGNGGNVEITAGSIELANDSQLITSTRGRGNAGNVVINARDRISLTESSGVFSSVVRGAIGNGGNVEMTTGALTVANGFQLIVNTSGTGNAGNLVINARDRVVFTGSSAKGQQASLAISSVGQSAIGNGGNIEITTGSLEVSQGAQLAASTLGAGTAGNIRVQAADAVTITGTTPADGRSSALFTSTLAADRNGGDITLNARSLRLAEGAVLDARTLSSGSSGNIVLNAATIDIFTGGQILAVTGGLGRAGTITINGTERITIAGRDATYEPQAGGGAGNIVVNTPRLHLDHQGTLNAVSSTVDGGNITLNIGNRLILRNGSQISATAGTANAGGNGGNITIDSPDGFLIAIPKENSDITANAFNGTGGNVTISNQGIFGLQFRSHPTVFSDITTSSEFGLSGTVTLNTPDTSGLQNGLNQLPNTQIDTNALLANSCIVRTPNRNNSFYVTGSSSLPLRPGDPPAVPYPTGELRAIPSAVSAVTRPPGNRWQKGDPIVEPDGIYQLPDGQLILSRECH